MDPGPAPVRPRGERRAVGLRRRADGVSAQPAVRAGRSSRPAAPSSSPPSTDSAVLISVLISSGCVVCTPPKITRRPSGPAVSAGSPSSIQSSVTDRGAPSVPSLPTTRWVMWLRYLLVCARQTTCSPSGVRSERHLAGRRRRRHRRHALPVRPCSGRGREREPCCGEHCAEGAPRHQARDRNGKHAPVGGSLIAGMLRSQGFSRDELALRRSGRSSREVARRPRVARRDRRDRSGPTCPASSPTPRRTSRRSFLPGDAESTTALEVTERLQGGETAPTVIVYRRDGGLTAEDRRTIASDVAELNRITRRFDNTTPFGNPADPRSQTPYQLSRGRDDGAHRQPHHRAPATATTSSTRSTPTARSSARTAATGLEVKVTGPGRHLGRRDQGLRGDQRDAASARRSCS